tara:strand:+ start:954 stop:1358 length:405 start_codon:yes stop_codon:yes gene_type:complete
VGNICAYHEQYDRASETFEALGMRCLQFNMRKFNGRTFFFRAGLCMYCKKDFKAAQRIRRRHKDLDYTFASTPDCRFLEDVGQSMRKFLNASHFLLLNFFPCFFSFFSCWCYINSSVFYFFYFFSLTPFCVTFF